MTHCAQVNAFNRTPAYRGSAFMGGRKIAAFRLERALRQITKVVATRAHRCGPARSGRLMPTAHIGRSRGLLSPCLGDALNAFTWLRPVMPRTQVNAFNSPQAIQRRASKGGFSMPPPK